MAVTGRPRTYVGDRPATPAERQARWRRQHRPTMAPDVVCRTLGACTLYCSRWEDLYALLPRQAAVITDPPYKVGPRGYDVTRARRGPPPWTQNFAGYDRDFDPTPWLRFPEVMLMGAERYYHQLPPGGSFCCWDKLAGTTPADFAAGELIWRSTPGTLQVFRHLWRGGMRAGEENYTNLPQKLHPAQKPVALMRQCVQLITPGRVIIDPFMGSGSTLVACVREGYPCIGIEINPDYFATACARVEAELQQLALFPREPA